MAGRQAGRPRYQGIHQIRRPCMEDIAEWTLCVALPRPVLGKPRPCCLRSRGGRQAPKARKSGSSDTLVAPGTQIRP